MTSGADILFPTERQADEATVTVQGEIDLLEAAQLREQLLKLVDTGSTSLIVDLTGVTFIGSTGIGALIAGHNRVREVGGTLTLRGPSRSVLRVMEITALDKVFPIVD